MNTAIPVFDKKNLQYERQEKDGYYTFVPKKHQETRELIINGTSRRILDLCNGESSMADIVAGMQAEYPNVERETIQNDVLKTLGNFSRMGVVTWNSENPFINYTREPLGDRYSMGVAQENDIRRILAFIRKHHPASSTEVHNDEGMVVFWSPDGSDKEYSEAALRAKLFAFSEEFLMLYEGDDVVGIFGVEPPPARRAVSSIRFAVCPEACFGPLMDYGVSILPQLAVAKPAKYRILVLEGQVDGRKTAELIQAAGFTPEALLKDELGAGLDLTSYVYRVSP